MKVKYIRPVLFNPGALFSEQELNMEVNFLLRNFITKENQIYGKECIPGSIIASPSIPEDPETDQNYVYDWIRDSAICVLSLVDTFRRTKRPDLEARLVDYVNFVNVVQKNSESVSFGWARWNLNGTPSKNWTVQNDGPALRAIALCQILDVVEKPDCKKMALKQIRRDMDYVCRVYKDKCTNIWEEVSGSHFFAKNVIRRAIHEVQSRKIGLDNYNSSDLERILRELGGLIDLHWDADHYRSQCDSKDSLGCDVSIEVVMGLLYGEFPGQTPNLGEEKSLLTLKKVIKVFENYFAINSDDRRLGIGPNLGRYPQDSYDGDIFDGAPTAEAVKDFGHPWFISNNVFANCFYLIAKNARLNPEILNLAKKVFSGDVEKVDDLIEIGNRFVLATKRHWDHGRMSEQFDRDSGFMRSVRDLSWSYASYIMTHWAYFDLLQF